MPVRIGVLTQAPDAPLTSSAWIRLLLPLQLLEREGHCKIRLLQWPKSHQPALPRLRGLAALIVQRAACPSLPWAEALVTACQARGLALIFDLDDALFALPVTHPEHQRYAPTLAALNLLLVQASLRVYSSSALAELCGQHLSRLRHADQLHADQLHADQLHADQPYALLSNGLDPTTWDRRRFSWGFRNDDPLQLLYMGTRTHNADLELILPELDALAAARPGLFELILIGGTSEPLQGQRPWLQTLEVPLQARRYPQFVDWLRQRPRADLGLAPLAPNPFNAAKSDLKVLDYAALDLPTLCSPGPAYDGLLASGLADGAVSGEWGQRISWAARHRWRLRWRAYRARRYLWTQRTVRHTARDWGQLLSPTAVWRRLSP
jgi:hypothetical protein